MTTPNAAADLAPVGAGRSLTPSWWRRAVVYQTYIRSFVDSTGDGIGDVRGLRSRLPYLADLGVDAIWVNPWYPSPLLDGGYDVADYRDIDPRLGTLGDAEQFIADAHAHGIRVIADLVPNHTSHDHVWFRQALQGGPGSPARGRYHFRPGRGPDGSEPPNNWRSIFGGAAWSRVEDGEWYLHLFDSSQPDLNWSREDVRAEFLDILRFWLDRGVDGFRVDVAHALVKDPALPDLTGAQRYDGPDDAPHPHWDRPELHEIIRSWRALVDTYPDRMLVAEASVHPNRLPDYLRDDEYHQAFNFKLLETAWRGWLQRDQIPRAVRAAAAVGSTPTWVWSNHDQVRHVTRFALPTEVDAKLWLAAGDRRWLDLEQGQRRGRAAALLLLALPGSAYVYQGEELGLPEVVDLPDSALQDPEFRRSDGVRKGRDGCRVPLPWAVDGPSFGFGEGGSWLPQPSWFGRFAAATQVGEPDSMHALYRTAIALRRQHGMADEDYEVLDLGRDVVAFRRGSGLACVVNMGTQPVTPPAGDVLLCSNLEGLSPDGTLLADDAVWLLTPA